MTATPIPPAFLRALSLNVFAHHEGWPARREALRAGCGDHGPALRVADCRLVLDGPVDGVQPSDHYGVLADLGAGRPDPAGR